MMKIGYYGFFAAVLALGVLLLATLIPIPGNYEVKIVQSGSMEPAIQTGGIVIVQPTGDYVVGDVVTYGPDTQTQVPTTHRIVEIDTQQDQPRYITKGDANDDVDPSPVSEDEIVGEVLFDIPYLGFVLDFARQPVGFILLVGIPAGIVVIDEMVAIYREVKKSPKKKEEDEEKVEENE